jgi:hypothetical protein
MTEASPSLNPAWFPWSSFRHSGSPSSLRSDVIKMSTTHSSPPSLITPFTPPASCFTSLNVLLWETGYAFLLGPSPIATECYPPQWTSLGNFYFSPGACPVGYFTARSTTEIAGAVTETRATCCPRYSRFAASTISCASPLPNS